MTDYDKASAVFEAMKEHGPSCLHCSRKMEWHADVTFTDDKGVTVVMGRALVCECGYRTIRGHQFNEFSAKRHAAMRAKSSND